MMNDQSTDWEAQVELLMNAFLANEEVYAALARQLGALLTTLLEREGVVVQSLAHRVKSQASLRRKLIKGKEKYDALSDVTDVVGCRLIVYLKEDVRKVAELVERSFSIDAANSVDKAALLDPDRFGYISLHYVARIGEDRSNLPEYRHFASIPFELQIRTVLQHAWAEIEHDLGYKSTFEIPREVRRQFSRLAGLLEIADDEFMSIKARLDQYAREVEEGIESTPELFGVDRESVAGLVERNTMVKEIDTQVATLIGARLQDPADYQLSTLATRLQLAGFKDLTSVRRALELKRDSVISFAERWLGESRGRTMAKGSSLFYLSLYEVGRSGTVDTVADYLRRIGLRKTPAAGAPSSFEAAAQQVIDAAEGL